MVQFAASLSHEPDSVPRADLQVYGLELPHWELQSGPERDDVCFM